MTYVLVIVVFVGALLAYRSFRAKQAMEWSRGKGIVAYGPAAFGHHFIYIDKGLNVAIFLPKEDRAVFVLTGNPIRAGEWQKFDKDGASRFDGGMGRGLDWKITPSGIFYTGPTMLPRQGPPYKATGLPPLSRTV